MKKIGKFHFYNEDDLISSLVKSRYKEDSDLVVIYDAQKAFVEVPNLILLKRDNFKVYIEGLQSNYLFIVFNNTEEAKDFVYNISPKLKIKWNVFHGGELVLDSM
jgi:tRNA A-37 threonylcarbamoyl transferase component Bud32